MWVRVLVLALGIVSFAHGALAQTQMDLFDYLNLISEIGATERRLTDPQSTFSDDEYAEAEAKIRKALDNVDQVPFEGEGRKARLLQTLGKVQRSRGDFSGAEASLANALMLRERMGDENWIVSVLEDLIVLYKLQDRRDEAKLLAERTWKFHSGHANVYGCRLSEATPDCSVPLSGRVEKEKDLTGPLAAVRILFGTNRKMGQTQLSESVTRIVFQEQSDTQLTLGQAMVSVPRDHKITQIERPWVLTVGTTIVYKEMEDPARHFVIQSISATNKEDFIASANSLIRASSAFKDQAFVFVHGYNVGFDDALYRVAQLAYDLQFDGVPFLYSWPSARDIGAYAADMAAAAQAHPHLEEFVRLILDRTDARTVHIIAHSMGHEPVLAALQNLRQVPPAGRSKFGQLVLAAPDIARNDFAHRLAELEGLAPGATLYASSKDLAMRASRVWHRGQARAGDVPPEGPLVVRGAYTIDATYLGTDVLAVNHSGYAESRELINDISLLFRHGRQPPKDRWPVLRTLERGQETYWEYPPRR